MQALWFAQLYRTFVYNKPDGSKIMMVSLFSFLAFSLSLIFFSFSSREVSHCALVLKKRLHHIECSDRFEKYKKAELNYQKAAAGCGESTSKYLMMRWEMFWWNRIDCIRCHPRNLFPGPILGDVESHAHGIDCSSSCSSFVRLFRHGTSTPDSYKLRLTGEVRENKYKYEIRYQGCHQK